jgi:hypothetical protein
MKRRNWLIGLTALFLGFASVFIVRAKVNQRELLAELLKQGLAVQFRSGEYCELIQEVKIRNWLFDKVDVIYFDVPHGTTPESLSRLRQLPTLTRVIVRYQGDDFEQFRLNRADIEEIISSECALVKKAIPGVEVLSVWAIGQERNAG